MGNDDCGGVRGEEGHGCSVDFVLLGNDLNRYWEDVFIYIESNSNGVKLLPLSEASGIKNTRTL